MHSIYKGYMAVPMVEKVADANPDLNLPECWVGVGVVLDHKNGVRTSHRSGEAITTTTREEAIELADAQCRQWIDANVVEMSIDGEKTWQRAPLT